MKPHRISPTVLAVLSVLATAPLCLAAPSISGDYLEARTSDIYTGPCFGNSEVNLAGKEAVVAWRVRQGAWRGVPVEGLSVVAVVRAAATLGDPTETPLPARAVLLVDEPFDGLDLRQSREMAATLLDHAASGRTLMLSIHQISDAARVCSRFVLLSGGRVCGDGTLDELATLATGRGAAIPERNLEEVFLALT